MEKRPYAVYLANTFMTPDQPGSLRTWQTARKLIEYGFDVTVVTTGTHYMTGRRDGSILRTFTRRLVDGIGIREVYAPADYRKSLFRRIWYSLIVGLGAWGVLMTDRRHPDVVIAATPPSTLGIAGWMAAVFRRSKFVYEVRDFQVDDAIALGLVRRGIVTRVALGVERFLYQQASVLTAVTPGIQRILTADKGIPSERIVLAPTGYDREIFSQLDADRETTVAVRRKELDWESRFVVLYAGALGLSYNIQTLLEAAWLLRDDGRFVFAIVGEGERRVEYEAQCDQRGMRNWQFFGAVPRREIPVLCASADVCVSMFPRDVLWEHVLGNKTFDYLGSGRPMVFAGAGDTAELLVDSGGGIVVPPEDPGRLAHALRTLADDPQRRKQMGNAGREYVRKVYDRQRLLEPLAKRVRALVEQP